MNGSIGWVRGARQMLGGVVGAVTIGLCYPVAPCVAQAPMSVRPGPSRLSVRPQAMATGQRTDKAGVHTLDSLPNYLAYVPEQCVGTRRCPLVVFLPGGGGSSNDQIDRQRTLADKYGMIVLAPNALTPGRWDILVAMMNESGALQMMVAQKFQELNPDTTVMNAIYGYENPDVKNIDVAMKQVLRKFAIDPNKIALAGMSDGGMYALFLGRSNLDVFSRIAAISPSGNFGGSESGPPNPSTQFFLASGTGEGDLSNGSNFMFQSPFELSPELQEAGHTVTRAIELRGHEQRLEDYDWFMRWLQESWTTPSGSRAAPRALADSTTLLSEDVVARMKAFWNAMGTPELVAARRERRQELSIGVGDQTALIMMPDVRALAAKYPAAAAALTSARMTVEQEEVYRIALLRARVIGQAESVVGTVPATSVLGQNIAFVKAHPAVIELTDMW